MVNESARQEVKWSDLKPDAGPHKDDSLFKKESGK